MESNPQTSTEQYWEKAVLDFDHNGLQVYYINSLWYILYWVLVGSKTINI